jgi:hypothetical protein
MSAEYLTGDELLATIQAPENAGLTKKELAKKCGYVNDKGMPKTETYLENVLKAQNTYYGRPSSARGVAATQRGGNSFLVQKRNLVLAGRFLREADCLPGDYAKVMNAVVTSGVIDLSEIGMEDVPDGTAFVLLTKDLERVSEPSLNNMAAAISEEDEDTDEQDEEEEEEEDEDEEEEVAASSLLRTPQPV